MLDVLPPPLVALGGKRSPLLLALDPEAQVRRQVPPGHGRRKLQLQALRVQEVAVGELPARDAPRRERPRRAEGVLGGGRGRLEAFERAQPGPHLHREGGGQRPATNGFGCRRPREASSRRAGAGTPGRPGRRPGPPPGTASRRQCQSGWSRCHPSTVAAEHEAGGVGKRTRLQAHVEDLRQGRRIHGLIAAEGDGESLGVTVALLVVVPFDRAGGQRRREAPGVRRRQAASLHAAQLAADREPVGGGAGQRRQRLARPAPRCRPSASAPALAARRSTTPAGRRAAAPHRAARRGRRRRPECAAARHPPTGPKGVADSTCTPWAPRAPDAARANHPAIKESLTRAMPTSATTSRPG